jgi:anti-sigma B factor antagonist
VKFSIQKKGSHTRIIVNKENLDTMIAPELKAELVAIVGSGEKNVLIDLSNCSLCDSSGLSVLLLGNRLCLESKGKFVLCGPSFRIRESLNLLGFENFLTITDTREEAESFFEC